MLTRIATYASVVFLALSCTSAQQTTTLNYRDYKIEKQTKVDSNLIKLIAPYGDSVKLVMSKVIGFTTRGLMKRQPEGELGNFMADCLMEMGEKKFNKKIDISYVNAGGIRSYIPKGEISIGKIFELMPFDNLVVLQEVKGNILLQFLNAVAEKGPGGLAGIKMKIKDKVASNILIDGKPLDANKMYTVCTSDYTANGGGEGEVLHGIKQVNMGYLFRDALMEYVEQITKQGKPVDWKTEGRVTY